MDYDSETQETHIYEGRCIIDDYSAPGTCWALRITMLVIWRLKTGFCLPHAFDVVDNMGFLPPRSPQSNGAKR